MSRLGLLFLPLFLVGCAATPDIPESAATNASAGTLKQQDKPQLDRVGRSPESLLSYYQALAYLSPNELLREKRRLAGEGNDPDTRLRQAMVMSDPRQPAPDMQSAVAFLNGLLKAQDSVSYYLRPIARLLLDSCNERLRLERQMVKQNAQLEKQYQRLLEFQRRSTELQEKLDGLANIERSLPRSRSLNTTRPDSALPKSPSR
ncbi:MAG: hypothetical protein LBG69_07915 [Zoogloeaceae bacterium]|jgi:PBP1b-binding outer membrane lipoprotein LpoB|nr:hypothetical protein [Zoogloeaceae bacterium]